MNILLSVCSKSIQIDLKGFIVLDKYKNFGISGYSSIFGQRHGSQSLGNQKEVS